MTVQSGSRYAQSTVVILDVNDIPRNVIVGSPQEPYVFNYESYQTDASDRPDTLAYDFYGDPSLWWMIADANPEIMDWGSVPAGTIIRVPNI